MEKVFRGKPCPHIVDLSKAAYKNDFKLVPKDEEHVYLKQTMPLEEAAKVKKVLPEFLEFPPLLRVIFSLFFLPMLVFYYGN